MYCPKCGTKLPDDANFCLKCGNLFHSVSEVKDEEKWIYCEIVWTMVKPSTLFTRTTNRFSAKAIGPTGSFETGTTDVFYSDAHIPNWIMPRIPPIKGGKAFRIAQGELDKLIDKLSRDGWEFVGSYGTNYWEKRFRRRE